MNERDWMTTTITQLRQRLNEARASERTWKRGYVLMLLMASVGWATAVTALCYVGVVP